VHSHRGRTIRTELRTTASPGAAEINQALDRLAALFPIPEDARA